MTTLPSTSKLFLPAFFTILRKPSLKSRMNNLEKTFVYEYFNQNNLSEYKSLLAYKSQGVPLTYLYLLAQKAQIALMLDKKFIYPLIGMVHMDNEMELLKQVSDQKAIELSVSSGQFFNEEKNRAEVNFLVIFKQDGEKVALCKSKYLAMSGKRPKSDKKAENEVSNTDFTQISANKFKVSDARTYARVSGDYNLIHLSPLLAKLFGFRSSLLHGMYMNGLMASQIINHTNKDLKKIYVQFKKPLLLPNEIQSFIAPKDEKSGELKVISSKGHKVILDGTFELF